MFGIGGQPAVLGLYRLIKPQIKNPSSEAGKSDRFRCVSHLHYDFHLGPINSDGAIAGVDCQPRRRRFSPSNRTAQRPFCLRRFSKLPRIGALRFPDRIQRLFSSAGSRISRKANAAELPARLGRKEIAIRCSDVTRRRSARSAPQHILIAHELAVVFAERTGRRRVPGIGRVRTLRPLPDLAEQLHQSVA
jgi:hypothetical protein